MADPEATPAPTTMALTVVADDDFLAEIIGELEDPLSFSPSEFDSEPAVVPLPNEPPFRIPKGKYAGLVLPRSLGVKPSMLAKVEALKAEIIADPEFKQYATSIGATYVELRKEAEAKARELSEIKTRMTAVMLLMIDQLEVEATTQLVFRGGAKVRVQPEPHLVVIDKEAFRVWCKDNGLEGSMVLPWASANKMVKEMLLTGAPEPPGTTAYMRPKVVYSKGDE